MLLHILALALLCHAIPAARAGRVLTSRIVGGNNTTIKSHPYYAAVLFRGYPVCGGTLFTSTKVLTSASCISGYRPDMLSIQVGSAVIGDGISANVTKFCIHPNFTRSPPSYDYDVAVIYVNKYIYTSPTVQYISLRAKNLDVPTGKLATEVGFGTQGATGATNKILQEIGLPRIRDIDCQRYYPNENITDRMVCFGYLQGAKDACNAGGSPLMFEGRQVGIDSWSYGCAFPSTPRVFTRVYDEEIYDHIMKC